MQSTALLLGALVAITSPLGLQASDSPLSKRERAVHLLSRFSFGPRPGEVERILELGEAAWVEEQLAEEPLRPTSLSRRLSGFETLLMSPLEVLRHIEYELPPDPTREERAERNKRRAIPKNELLTSIVLRSVHAKQQLEEVLGDFWRNHFNVSYTKTYPVELYITDYERNVIQYHALGSFPSMLSASAHHPAMMLYLDNHVSRRPPSSQELAELERRVRQETGSKERGEEAALIASQRGVNENYARELLELHTLGVDRTYRQKDVIVLAETLTGWGISTGEKGHHGFAFNYQRHIPGDKKFLGYVLRKDKEKGTGQGERVLEILSRHNDTANFVATKLVRYFVADDPPPGLVKDVAQTYKKSKGDIRRLVRTILDSDEFWQRRYWRAKFKTPNEFLMSALRATGAEVSSAGGILKALASMGQPTYHCDDPTGWYDTADAWLAPGVMARRWQIALQLAGNKLDGVEIPASFYGEISTDVSPLAWMREMVDKVLPGGASTRTLAMLHEVVREHVAEGKRTDLRKLGPEVLGLLLGSPEFQEQ
jgi:uncharacterized protein (DUF1800 family)